MNRESNMCNSYKKYNFELGIFVQNCCQPLREAVSWNNPISFNPATWQVSLFVRLWVEMLQYSLCKRHFWSASSWGCELKYWVWVWACRIWQSQPLREAVSWNVCLPGNMWIYLCQPLREAVSWNEDLLKAYTKVQSQPLREAVSWNIKNSIVNSIILVSLFVRLWVEIDTMNVPRRMVSSASSWGCELK